ncbi:carboxypeptidase-like regulatory domain-containing protein [Flavobacterium sp. SUN052]|uniref:TonB-dependent receptor n=1 Tax=Flavobacterium sp. SUN052 TaxID=3002441 RepID=UPI00237DA5A2|nr:TonB-dependent receptor [Flavobacterium sp. SUN052]MEC4004047.1 carboxypeptidase-like regulatory domain-containing protein [Flavobacterium sp. SUN052]
MKFKYTIVLLLFIQLIYSQAVSKTANIKGVVVEESTGKPLPGVNIIIRSLKLSTITDSDGNFLFRNLSEGKYEIEFSFLSFETKIVSDVEAIKNETTTLSVSLTEKKNTLDEVVITRTKAKAESVKSLLLMQKNSIRVSDGISAETIKRTPDRTTSDVLKRISGASVQDNKFVVVRGLNDRYNTSFLNGSPLPSSEPDRKAFSFDIFPANMIDNLVIYKTASPDLPGEFAGGVIDITTKSTADKNFQSLSVGAGYNTITTGKKQVYAEGGKKDWLGVDDGTRAFPSYIPSTQEFQALQQQNTQSSVLQISDYAKSFQTDWSLKEKSFSPNTSFNYTIGRHAKFDDGTDFGFVGSITKSTTNNYLRTTRKTYEIPTVLLENQVDDRYSVQSLFGAIANFSLKLNPNNSFSFKNLYSINSNNSVIDRSGALTQESDPLQIHTTARLFTSNTIYTGQLNGEHFLPESKIKISWVGSYSKVVRNTPNDRRNTYTYVKFDDGTVSQPSAYFQVNTTGDESPGSFFSSKNDENIFSTKADVSRKFKFTDKIALELKAGFFTQSRNRIFEARQVGYVPFTGNVNGVNYNSNTFQSSIQYLDEEHIFNSANMGIISPGVSGLTLFDGTKQNDSYKAASKLDASYLMLDNSFGIFRLIWGMRIEHYSQDLNSKLDNGQPVVINNSQVDYLPSANLIAGITKKQNIRLSFSKTLNRPEFRELAPFLFYDASTKFNTQGTPTLKIANITNYDFRYEIFPGKGQLFSMSAFYKKFENPIELQALANNSNKYQNAKSGECKGIELEYRTLLSSLFNTKENKTLDNLTLFTNIAIIRSKVDISNLITSADLTNIPLQGQSPYVFNGGLQYINTDNGWASSINVNRVGDRIAIQGNQTAGATTPALWEKSRTFLDMQVSKSFMKNKLEFKFNIQNLLAQDLTFYQNNEATTADVKKGFKALVNNVFTGDRQNKNGFDEKVDDEVWSTKFGRTFSFTVTYNF